MDYLIMSNLETSCDVSFCNPDGADRRNGKLPDRNHDSSQRKEWVEIATVTASPGLRTASPDLKGTSTKARVAPSRAPYRTIAPRNSRSKILALSVTQPAGAVSVAVKIIASCGRNIIRALDGIAVPVGIGTLSPPSTSKVLPLTPPTTRPPMIIGCAKKIRDEEIGSRS